jgi:hypothetical protein
MERTDPRVVTLGGMRGGAVEELFQQELLRVLQNIDDPNTAAKAKREIVLKFKLSASEDRDVVSIEVASSAKLAGIRPLSAMLHMGKVQGSLALIEPLRQEVIEAPPGPSGVVQGGRG